MWLAPHRNEKLSPTASTRFQVFFFSSLLLSGEELSDTKVYEP